VEKKLVHTLTRPLKIATAKPEDKYYFLPPGTVLYYDAPLPEKFDRYYVYINVEGKPLEVKPVEREGLIAPLNGTPDPKEGL
jgi:hypothetical protein